MNVPVLRGKTIVLRPAMRSDIDDRVAAGRYPEIVRMYGGDTRHIPPITYEDAEKELFPGASALKAIRWVIDSGGKGIGGVRLTLFETDRKARFAIGLYNISDLGKGIGTEATRLVLRYAFESLGLHRIDLRVLEYNKRAITCYRKCGFVEEGVERESALVEDKWETDVMMSILENEYRTASAAWDPVMQSGGC